MLYSCTRIATVCVRERNCSRHGCLQVAIVGPTDRTDSGQTDDCNVYTCKRPVTLTVLCMSFINM